MAPLGSPLGQRVDRLPGAWSSDDEPSCPAIQLCPSTMIHVSPSKRPGELRSFGAFPLRAGDTMRIRDLASVSQRAENTRKKLSMRIAQQLLKAQPTRLA